MAEPKLGTDVKVAFFLSVTLIVIAALVNSGGLAWALAPFFVSGILFAIWRAPLRYSILTLMFFAFTLENPNELPANGYWQSPLFPIGTIMFVHIKNMTSVSFLFLSGMEYLLIFLGLVALVRRSTGSKIDQAGRVPTPQPLLRLALVSLTSTLLVWLHGLATGGDFSKSLWQVEKVIYLPIVFLVCSVGLRGSKDHVALGKVLLTAAAYRACFAFYVKQTVVVPVDPNTGEAILAYATSHHDSMLFASACVLLLLLIVERAGKRFVRLAALLLPLLVVGMISNNRRMVWVQIGLVFFTLYLATPPNPIKRKVKKILLYLSPLIAAYFVVGWNSKAGIFKGAQMARSVVEPSTDASSLWREIENYDILFTFRSAPILGHGYGHPFWEIIPLPAVGYDLEQYCPHNSILGLWAFCGYFGFTGLVLLWAAGAYFAMRAYHASRVPLDRTAAVLCLGAVIIYMVQCYGDMGLGSWTGVFILGPSIAVAGKLAGATGAWGSSRKRRERDEAGVRAAPEPSAS